MHIVETILALCGKAILFVMALGALITGSAPAPTETQAPVPVVFTDTATTTAPSEATSTPAAKPTTTKPTAAAPQTTTSSAPVAAPNPVSPTTPSPTVPPEQINTNTRAALVNILCLPQVGLKGISGSGVLIDDRGVILTNSHIAQYFLLKDYLTANNVDCVVRTGSPAQSTYRARLLYLPPVWIAAHASQLTAVQATGTGENDYAFLLITGRTDPAASLPTSFSHLAMEAAYPDIGDSMLLAAYPAGFLSGQIIEKSLYASSAFAYVTQLFSFDDAQKVDLFSIGGSVVSQAGSSGGAAVRATDGKLAGIIVTATTAATTGERDLRAISISHIDNSLVAAGQGGIRGLLSGDITAKAADFNAKVAPGLTAQLQAILKGN